MNEILKISGNIRPTTVVWIQQCQKCMCTTSRDTMRYLSTVASEDPVCVSRVTTMYVSGPIYGRVLSVILSSLKLILSCRA